MNILVIGSGGREHAICHAFSRSPKVSQIFCAPGNAGIASIAECIGINAEDVSALAEFAAAAEIDLTFVGGETPLALGIVDIFEARGFKIIGSSKAAARLESSKAFAKDFMARHDVPTAKFETAESANEAVSILNSGSFGEAASPVVVKADGLAAGKGVVVAKDRAEAIDAINDMAKLVGADAAAKIVIEECLVGREVSLIMFADGEDFSLMPPTRDHKRIGEGDTGPNTGGMGTITDDTLLSPEQLQIVIDKFIKPTLKGCIAEGFPFRGILFLGLMISDSGVRRQEDNGDPDFALTGVRASVINLLEYNVRFGDPETQSILVRLETDFVDICQAMLSVSSSHANRGTSDTGGSLTLREGLALKNLNIKWQPGNSATVVLAAKGYPKSPQKGDVISGLDEAAKIDGVTIFHAGTSLSEPPVSGGGEVAAPTNDRLAESLPPTNAGGSDYLTAGGRVLGVTAVASNLDEALAASYKAVDSISWEGMQFRRDIGK